MDGDLVLSYFAAALAVPILLWLALAAAAGVSARAAARRRGGPARDALMNAAVSVGENRPEGPGWTERRSDPAGTGG